MQRLTIAAFLMIMAASAMAATSWSKDEKWHGPGWYVTVTSLMAATIEKGPFTSESECKNALPSDEEQEDTFEKIGYVYDCQNLQ
jgi:hypothetical protein